MKICYFGDGESIHVIRCCRFFASRGHEVHLISFKNVRIENVRTYYIDAGLIDVKGGNWKVLLKFRTVKGLLNKIRPDIFHSHYATSYGITGALCGFHPYVITAHGSDILLSGKQSFLFRKLLGFALKRADWIHVPAGHMLDSLRVLDIDLAKVNVLPFGIDAHLFNHRLRQLPEGKFTITSTRNLEPVYNIPHLIKAIAELKDRIPGLQLNIVGEGSLKAELKKMIVDLGLENCTAFFGKVSPLAMSAILNESHVYVTVSLSDGNSLSLAEAMACGALCIASNIPANTFWIKDSVNGFLVEINDVEQLKDKILNSFRYYDQIQQTALAVNDRLIEQNADWEKNMKEMEEKYLKLIND
jgi:glycosyltransferase involved in cell wall biosynthesis